MSFKKFDGSTWQPINPKKLKGIPYTGALPATLIGTKAGYLHCYKIYGNTERTGTPTPENPIEPSECGERTENLFEVENDMLSDLNWSLNPPYSEFGVSYFINYKLSDAMSQKLKSGQHTCSIFSHFTDGYTPNLLVCAFTPTLTNIVDQEYRILTNQGVTFTRTFNFSEWQDIYLIIGYGNGFRAEADKQLKIDELFANWRISIVPGATAPESYTPYGYKLPLTSAGQDVDIYLGESQTTRRIKKLVLTGEETNWSDVGGNAPYRIMLPDIVSTSDKNSVLFLSTHYLAVSNNASWERYNACVSWSFTFNTNGKWLQFRDTNQASLADFKAYLAQQYANGTPVTVWYVLENSETGTLNEPLRKIGDYADTIDSTQTTAQIPTSANSTTISWAGEGLAPSEFDSIQEWVDIPTYTYTNGAWVEDN